MKRLSIIIIAIICLLLFALVGCGGQTQGGGQNEERSVAPPAANEANESDEYAKLLAGAGADDLLMVYYDPPQAIVSRADARMVDPEKESGENILLVNISGRELMLEYCEIAMEPETSGTELWRDNLAPGDAVLLNSLYSEGIPNRAISINTKNDNDAYWDLVAIYDLVYDGSGMRGPVFVKTGDFPLAEVTINLDEPAFFTFVYSYNMEDDEYYYYEGPEDYELYIYLVPDGTGLLADAGEVIFIDWDQDVIDVGIMIIYEINPATSELVLYRDWGKDFYLYQPEVPERATEMYEGFLAWFEGEAVG